MYPLPIPKHAEGEEPEASLFAPDLHDARHLWLKAGLLAVWAAASFGVCFFARDLLFSVGDWPVGFWMASQGAMFLFMAIVVVYAMAMSRFERQDLLAARFAETGASVATAGAIDLPPSESAAANRANDQAKVVRGGHPGG